jgi:hypothetical protein
MRLIAETGFIYRRKSAAMFSETMGIPAAVHPRGGSPRGMPHWEFDNNYEAFHQAGE